MCGYGMQQLEETTAGLDVFTIGCLEKIARWAKHNLLLVAGLTGSLLLLEVNTAVGVAVFSLLTATRGCKGPQWAHSTLNKLRQVTQVFSKCIFFANILYV